MYVQVEVSIISVLLYLTVCLVTEKILKMDDINLGIQERSYSGVIFPNLKNTLRNGTFFCFLVIGT